MGICFCKNSCGSLHLLLISRLTGKNKWQGKSLSGISTSSDVPHIFNPNQSSDLNKRVIREFGFNILSKKADSTLKKNCEASEYILYVNMSKTACVRFVLRTECGCKGTILRKRCQVFYIIFFISEHKKRSPKSFDSEDLDKRRQLPTLPHCIAVPSAQAGLTSLFGMGRGGTPPQ